MGAATKPAKINTNAAKSLQTKQEQKKDERLNLRLNGEIKERIEHAARIEGQTLNAFAQQALLEQADRILEAAQTRCLDNAARDRFLALLDADTEPNERAMIAAEKFRKGQMAGDTYFFEL